MRTGTVYERFHALFAWMVLGKRARHAYGSYRPRHIVRQGSPAVALTSQRTAWQGPAQPRVRLTLHTAHCPPGCEVFH